MAKRKRRRQRDQAYQALQELAAATGNKPEPGLPASESVSGVVLSHASPGLEHGTESAQEQGLLKMGKFRFQLLHAWLVQHMPPCRVADIGGGKGLLAYLLQRDGWQAVVIDPVDQALPTKYRDIESGKRVRIAATERVPRLSQTFEPEMARDFDLLVGLHAHGANAKIIDASATYGCNFVLLPCCVIDEPFYPRLGVTWIESLMDYAARKGFEARPFRLGFSGQDIGLWGRNPS